MVFRGGSVQWVQAVFSFEAAGPPATICTAIVSLVQNENGEWRIWLLRTFLEQLKGQGNVDVLNPVKDAKPKSKTETHFDCVVVGGGQAGLSIGSRLQALGLSYVILDKNKEVGDSWKTRYDSTKCEHLAKS
jgi:hypothetical protein